VYGNGWPAIVSYDWRPLPNTATPTHSRVLIKFLRQGPSVATRTPVSPLVYTPGSQVPLSAPDYLPASLKLDPRLPTNHPPPTYSTCKVASCVSTVRQYCALTPRITFPIIKFTGIPEPVGYEKKIVGVVEYRDGTILDVIRQVKE
jgi:hypothetical protein